MLTIFVGNKKNKNLSDNLNSSVSSNMPHFINKIQIITNNYKNNTWVSDSLVLIF